MPVYVRTLARAFVYFDGFQLPGPGPPDRRRARGAQLCSSFHENSRSWIISCRAQRGFQPQRTSNPTLYLGVPQWKRQLCHSLSKNYFKECIIPFLRKKGVTKDDYVASVTDLHAAHEEATFQAMLREENIHTIFGVPKGTNWWQLQDAEPFETLKASSRVDFDLWHQYFRDRSRVPKIEDFAFVVQNSFNKMNNLTRNCWLILLSSARACFPGTLTRAARTEAAAQKKASSSRQPTRTEAAARATARTAAKKTGRTARTANVL